MATDYDLTPQIAAQVQRSFVYHPPKNDQAERSAEIRDLARAYATTMLRLTPPSREQSLALTHLEEAVMWANAAIARNEK